MSYFVDHDRLIEKIRTTSSSSTDISELDLFTPISYQRSIESCFWEEVFPNLGGLNRTVPEMIFHIKPGSNLIDLNDSWMKVTAKIMKNLEGVVSSPTSSDRVMPVNATLYSLFSDVDVQVNGASLHNTQGLYHLQSYLQLLLSMSTDSMPKWEIAGLYDDQMLTQR